ncbi:MAG TPA: sugar transferase, partial [Armatimonadota bacterium]|nr:sugar transferase [Armatimonadota bacterium]
MGARPPGLLDARNRAVKRVIDYLLGLPAFLLSLPVIAFFALWIKATGHGSAFYSQEREGIDGTRIRVWKLRTMYP